MIKQGELIKKWILIYSQEIVKKFMIGFFTLVENRVSCVNHLGMLQNN